MSFPARKREDKEKEKQRKRDRERKVDAKTGSVWRVQSGLQYAPPKGDEESQAWPSQGGQRGN